MVNIRTAVDLIDEFLVVNRVRKMKKWSTRFLNSYSNRPSWYAIKLIKKIRNILNLISGDDVESMLKSVLTSKQLEKIVPLKYNIAFTNLSENYSRIKLKKRHSFMKSLKSAGFSYRKVRQFGFKVSKNLWTSCINSLTRNKGGGQNIKIDLQESLYSYFKKKSYPASNRTVCMKINDHDNVKEVRPVRYLHDNQNALFLEYPFKNEISFGTFKNYLKKYGIYKNPHRLTDLCDYCQWLKSALKDFNTILKSEFGEHLNDDQLNIDKLTKHFESKKNKIRIAIQNNPTEIANLKECGKILEILTKIEHVMYHKMIANYQREAYNYHRNSLEILRTRLLIEVDYKQKVTIGLSPKQVNKEYYNQEKRCLLGFGVYSVVDENINVVNFDVITNEDDKEDMTSVVRGFRLLREQAFFKDLDTKDYILWMDCGKHFRNREVVGYLFKELADEKIHVNLNFFAEKHGKSNRDTHFSCISRYLKSESLVSQIVSSKAIADAINKRSQISNQNRILLGKMPLKTIAIEFTSEMICDIVRRYPVNKELKIQNIESYYNYTTLGNNFEIYSSILSNNKLAIDLKKLNGSDLEQTEKDYSSTFIAEEEIIQAENIDQKRFDYLALKNLRAKIAFRKIDQIKHDENLNVRAKSLESIEINGLKEFNEFLKFSQMRDLNPIIGQSNLLLNSNRTEISNQPETTARLVKPKFCRDSKSTKKTEKKGCKECKKYCMYSLSEIQNPVSSLGQKAINEELANHEHPKSRLIQRNDPNESTGRRTDEARLELIDHYIFAHNL